MPCADRLEQRSGGLLVDIIVMCDLVHRLARAGFCGQVHHSFNSTEDLIHHCPVPHVGADELNLTAPQPRYVRLRQSTVNLGAEIIDNCYSMTIFQQRINQPGANESSAASDKNFHIC